MKKVLIISYNFPPKSGISSRRWAKLSKALTRSGIECYILTRDGVAETGYNWSRDIKQLDQNRIITVKNIYPRYFERSYSSFLLNGLKYVGIKILRSTFFQIDASQLMYKRLISKARELIDQGVNNIIVSGPPHSLIYQTSILKYENPEINLILDYRDAWNDELNYKYLTNIHSLKRKTESIQMELLSLNCADKVLLVTDDLRSRLSKIHDHWSHKFMAFHNFFDLEDYQESFEKIKRSKNIVYLGTIKSGRRKSISLIINALIKLEEEGVEFDRQFHFYTKDNFTPFFRDKVHLETIKKYFRFYPIVDSSKVWKVLEKYSFCLSINDPNYSHAFGTKIFDYMALKKTIIHISNGGELYNLLKNQNHLVSNYKLESMIDMLKQLQKVNFDFIDYEFNEFDLNNKVQQLIKYLK